MRLLKLCSASLAFASLAFVAVGCAHLPYILTETRDTLVGVEVAMQPDAVFEKRAGVLTSRITLLRGFVRGSEVDEFAAVVRHVISTTRFDGLNLTATGYQKTDAGPAIALELSPALRQLEERMVDGFRVFAVRYPDLESAEEFIVTADGIPMSEATIARVERFVPDASGPLFQPHAPVTKQDASLSNFSFRPAAVAVYQIGSQGRAEKLLWTMKTN